MLVLLSILSACTLGGPDCRSACNRIYDQSSCNIQRPGRSADDLIEQCEDYCESASAESGEVGDYDPSEPYDGSTALENRAQADLWVDCVLGTSCEELSEGSCVPIW